jgi:hypothetical protein
MTILLVMHKFTLQLTLQYCDVTTLLVCMLVHNEHCDTIIKPTYNISAELITQQWLVTLVAGL